MSLARPRSSSSAPDVKIEAWEDEDVDLPDATGAHTRAGAPTLLQTLSDVCWKAVAPSAEDSQAQEHRRQLLTCRSTDNDALVATLQCLCIACGVEITLHSSISQQIGRLQTLAPSSAHPYARGARSAAVLRALHNDFELYAEKAVTVMQHKLARATLTVPDAEQRFLAALTLGNMYTDHPAWKQMGAARMHLTNSFLYRVADRLRMSPDPDTACVSKLLPEVDALALSGIDALSAVHVPEGVGRAQIASRWKLWRREAEQMLTSKACADIVTAIDSIANAYPLPCMLSVLRLEDRMPEMARKIVTESQEAWATLFAECVANDGKTCEALKRALTKEVQQQDVFASEIAVGFHLLDDLASASSTSLNLAVCESIETLLGSLAQFPNLCDTNIAPVLNLLSSMHDSSLERMKDIGACNTAFLEWLQTRVATCLSRAVKKKALRMLLYTQASDTTTLNIRLQPDEVSMIRMGEEHKTNSPELAKAIGKMSRAWSVLGAFESDQKQLSLYAAKKAAAQNASTKQLLDMPRSKARAVSRGFANAPRLLSDIVENQEHDKAALNSRPVPMSVQQFADVAQLLAQATDELSASAETPTDFASCVQTAELMISRLQIVHEDMQQRNAVGLLYHGRFLAAVDAALLLLRPASPTS